MCASQKNASGKVSRQASSWLTVCRFMAIHLMIWYWLWKTNRLLPKTNHTAINNRRIVTSLHCLFCHIYLVNVLISQLYQYQAMRHSGLNWCHPTHDISDLSRTHGWWNLFQSGGAQVHVKKTI